MSSSKFPRIVVAKPPRRTRARKASQPFDGPIIVTAWNPRKAARLALPPAVDNPAADARARDFIRHVLRAPE